MDDAGGFDDQILRQSRRNILDRDVNGDRDDREFLTPEHHDRMRVLAHHLVREPGKIFGMSGIAEARRIQNRFGDWIGDDGGGMSLCDVAGCTAYCGKHGGCARCVRFPGLGCYRSVESDNGKGALKYVHRFLRLHALCRNLEIEQGGAREEILRVSDDIEGREPKFVPAVPAEKCNVGTDARRFADG